MVNIRRGVLAIGVLLAIAAAILVWRTRSGERAGTATHVDIASPSSMQATAKPRAKADPTWLAQAGVAGRRIAGVVTTEDGAPVRGADVRLASAITRAKPGAEPRVVTDDAGRFDFGVQPAMPYFVGAEAQGLTGAVASIDLRDPMLRPAPDQLRLTLQPCVASIHGTIRDSAGGVVPGTRISRAGFSLTTSGGAEADAQGAYELCVPPGTTSITVSAEGYATLAESVSAFGRTRRDFELVPGATVVGRVVRAADKTPVAGAIVELRARGGSGAVLHATSDDEGRFEIDGVVTGRHLITATADGLATAAPVWVDAEVGTPSEEVVCPLVAAYSLAGKVVERDGGKPIAGADVRLLSTTRSSEPTLAVSQADGSFVLERILPDDYHVVAIDLSSEEPQRVKIAASNVTGLVVEVDRRASIAGRVVFDRKPIAGVTVRVEGSLFQSETDHEGRYTLSRLPAGTHRLYAESHRHGAFTRGAPITLAAGDAKTGVDLELDLAGSIEGVVVDQNSAPVSGVYLRFSLLGGLDGGAATTAENGSFAARALSGGGDYAYEVRQREGSGMTFAPVTGKRFPPVTVADGRTHVMGVRIAIRFERLSITGRVTDADGNPQADVRVRASLTEKRYQDVPIATTDERGAFTLRDLPAGTYDLHARSLHGDAREAKVEAGRTGVVLRLIGFSSIEGVLDGFTSKAEVVARHESGVRYRAVVTDHSFKLRELPPGTYSLMAFSPTEMGGATAATTPGAPTKVTLAKQPTGIIEGTVRDEKTGVPIEGLYCSAILRGGDRSSQLPFGYTSDNTAANGAFRIERAQVGVHEVTCSGETARASGVVRAGEITRVELTAATQVETPVGTIGMELQEQLGELRVQLVMPGGPAARAGIAVGDILVKLNGRAVNRDAQYSTHELDYESVGTTVKLVLERGDKQLNATLVYEADRQ